MEIMPFSVLHDSAVRCSIFDIRRFFVFPGLVIALFALSGCGLLPEQSYSVPNSDFVLHYPAGWTASPNVERFGLSTVFSPDARPGPRSTRIVLMRGAITPEPAPGATRTSPAIGVNPDDPKKPAQWSNYSEHRTLRPENLHGVILSQDLGLNAEGLRVSRFVIQPAWAIEAYAPPSDFATIRSTAQRMAAALNRPAKPAATK
jgi:hypothetical protein